MPEVPPLQGNEYKQIFLPYLKRVKLANPNLWEQFSGDFLLIRTA
jgi:hypothetical protein